MQKQFEVRFWSKVLKQTVHQCWPWQAGTTVRGYGRIRRNGRLELSHRVAWELKFGPVPKGHCVLHECDNPPCCNPEHLFKGTKRDNTKDMLMKGRQGKGAKLTEEQVKVIRSLSASMLQKDIAKRFGLSHTHVSQIVTRKFWVHV